MLALSESDTRAKLIDPAIHAPGWTGDLIRHDRTPGEIIYGNSRPKLKKGREVAQALAELKGDGGRSTRG